MLKIDSVIPYMSFGAIIIAATYFTFYIYFVKDEILTRYRKFLWMLLVYIVFKEFILSPRPHTPLFLYFISEVLYWGSLILYIRYIFITIDFKEKRNTFRILSNIAQLLHVFAFLIFVVFQIFLPGYKNLFVYIFMPISIYVFIVMYLFIRYLHKGRILAYYRFSYVGSVLFIFFNTLSLFLYTSGKNFYSLSSFSILCIGWYLEYMMFILALCLRAKRDSDEKIRIILMNTSIEKKLLTQEIERQNTILESKNSERLKISIDIHDGISNAITGLKFYINDKRLQSLNDVERKLLRDLESEVNSIYIQVRNYIQKLYSGENEGTYDVISFLEMLQEQYKTTLIDFIINIEKDNVRKYLSSFQLNEFYFILNEIIGNAIKHSNGTKIEVNIHFDDARCYFSIQDNGIGFSYEKNKNTGFGLSNVDKRINKLFGEIDYHNSRGTKISGSFPYFNN